MVGILKTGWVINVNKNLAVNVIRKCGYLKQWRTKKKGLTTQHKQVVTPLYIDVGLMAYITYRFQFENYFSLPLQKKKNSSA